MNRLFGGILAAGILAGCSSPEQPVPQRAADEDPLSRHREIVYQNPLAQVNLQQNIGKIALDIEQGSGYIIPNLCDAQLENILEHARQRVRLRRGDPCRTLSDIDDLLRNELNYTAGEVDRFSESLLTRSSSGNVFDSDAACLIYLAIGEDLNLPLRVVMAPQRTFVRWHEGRKPYNWEVLDWNGLHEITDEMYRNRCHIARESIAQNVYMRSLYREEALALVYAGVGDAQRHMGKFEDAVRSYNQALWVLPWYPSCLNKKGIALDALGRQEEALRCYDRALSYDPHFFPALENKAGILEECGREQEARRCLRRAEYLRSRMVW